MRRRPGSMLLASATLAALVVAAPDARSANVVVEASDGRLETLLADLSAHAGRTIAVRPGERAPRAPRPRYSGESWQDVLAAICQDGELGLQQLPGGSVLVSAGPRLAKYDRTIPPGHGYPATLRIVLAGARHVSGRAFLAGPRLSLDRQLGARVVPERGCHWQQALRLAAPGSRARARGALVALDAEPFGWGEPVGSVDDVVAPGEEPRVPVRALNEPLPALVARLASGAGRTVGEVSRRATAARVTADLPAMPWRDALQAVTEAADVRLVEGDDGALALLEPAPRTWLHAHRAPLADWLQVLAAALGERLRVDGFAGGEVTASLDAPDVADVLSATLALWRCEAVREGDGSLRVTQTEPVPELGPRTVPPEALDAVDAALAGPPLQGPAADALARRVIQLGGLDAIFEGQARIPADEPRLATMRSMFVRAAATRALDEHGEALASRDVRRALYARTCLRTLRDELRPGPDLAWLDAVELRHARRMARLTVPVASWHLVATATYERGGLDAAACIGGRLVRPGEDVLDANRGVPMRLKRIARGTVEYERPGGALVLPMPVK